jgi:hypothetical protein
MCCRLSLIAIPLCAAFQGDKQAQAAAWVEIRTNFRKNADASDSDVPRLVADGREAAEFLQSAVVQGQLNERGNYGASLRQGYVTQASDTLLHTIVLIVLFVCDGFTSQRRCTVSAKWRVCCSCHRSPIGSRGSQYPGPHTSEVQTASSRDKELATGYHGLWSV